MGNPTISGGMCDFHPVDREKMRRQLQEIARLAQKAWREFEEEAATPELLRDE